MMSDKRVKAEVIVQELHDGTVLINGDAPTPLEVSMLTITLLQGAAIEGYNAKRLKTGSWRVDIKTADEKVSYA
jgi:hypothetical protein